MDPVSSYKDPPSGLLNKAGNECVTLDSVGSSKPDIISVLFKWTIPGLFFFYFRLFKTTVQFYNKLM